MSYVTPDDIPQLSAFFARAFQHNNPWFEAYDPDTPNTMAFWAATHTVYMNDKDIIFLKCADGDKVVACAR